MQLTKNRAQRFIWKQFWKHKRKRQIKIYTQNHEYTHTHQHLDYLKSKYSLTTFESTHHNQIHNNPLSTIRLWRDSQGLNKKLSLSKLFVVQRLVWVKKKNYLKNNSMIDNCWSTVCEKRKVYIERNLFNFTFFFTKQMFFYYYYLKTSKHQNDIIFVNLMATYLI